MKRINIPTFWQAVLLVIAAYLIFDNAFPPLMPKSLLLQFMIITIIGVLLYYSFDDARWESFKAPVLAVLRDQNKWLIRWGLLGLIPAVAAYVVYDNIKPSFEAPVELRQVHPAPPTSLRVFDKTYDLSSLENPVRQHAIEQLKSDPDKAWETYKTAVAAGRKIYYQNCLYCHGDLLEGGGIFAKALNPPPANFRDVGTIAQLQEAYLFWRITTGGPGLPKEGAPWNSAMPVWHEILGEEDVWNVITFLYDHVGQVPRMWDQEVSKSVSGMNEKIQSGRSELRGTPLYQFHCAACHGEQGEGNGPAAEFLYPKPRDFSIGLFKYKNSPPKTMPPTDEDLVNTIKEGLVGTAMPAWKNLLTEVQIRSLIPVIKGFDTVGTWAPEDAPDSQFDEDGHYLGDSLSIVERTKTDSEIPFTEESVKIGKQAFQKTCSQCHGDDGRGNPAVDKRLKDEWGGRIWPRDLTKPWTWRVTEASDSVEETIRNIYLRLSLGIPGTPMPAHADKLSEEDRWHIAHFVFTLRNYSPAVTKTSVLKGLKVVGDLPADINDEIWEQAPFITPLLLPNVIRGERLFKPLSDELNVRAIYNDEEIAFLLEMDDRTYSRPGDADAESTQDKSLKLYADAFAIQFPKAGTFVTKPVVEKPMFRHGDKKHPTTIWYWNAGAVEPEVSPQAAILDATGVDKKLLVRKADTSLSATGNWVNGRWRVMFRHSRKAVEQFGDTSFTEGRYIPVSFANWDGSNGEKASKHTLTPWYWLLLPEEIDKTFLYGLPVSVLLLLFIAGLALIRSQRSNT